MLALTRRAGQSLILTLPSGERISVMVVRSSDSKVRLGIDAPGDVVIHRDEVQRLIDDGESFARSGHDEPEDTDDPA